MLSTYMCASESAKVHAVWSQVIRIVVLVVFNIVSYVIVAGNTLRSLAEVVEAKRKWKTNTFDGYATKVLRKHENMTVMRAQQSGQHRLDYTHGPLAYNK